MAEITIDTFCFVDLHLPETLFINNGFYGAFGTYILAGKTARTFFFIA